MSLLHEQFLIQLLQLQLAHFFFEVLFASEDLGYGEQGELALFPRRVVPQRPVLIESSRGQNWFLLLLRREILSLGLLQHLNREGLFG